MGRYVRIVPSERVTRDTFTRVDIGDQPVLAVRLEDGRAVVFAAACPHQGQPLTFGEVEGGCIVCPHHRYAYDPATGRNVFPGDEDDLRLPFYAAVERDGWVWAAL